MLLVVASRWIPSMMPTVMSEGGTKTRSTGVPGATKVPAGMLCCTRRGVAGRGTGLRLSRRSKTRSVLTVGVTTSSPPRTMTVEICFSPTSTLNVSLSRELERFRFLAMGRSGVWLSFYFSRTVTLPT